MAIAFVNSCSGAGTQNGVTSSSMDTTGANLIVVSVAAYSSLGANLTDSESNTWTALSLDTNSNSLERIFYCISPTTSSSHTFTFNQSSTYPSISALAFSGVSAFDSENTSTQSSLSTTIQTGSVIPPVDGCLVFAGVCSAQGAIVTAIDSGFTLETAIRHVSAVNMGSGSAYLIQSSASAVNPQITSSSSNYLAASIAVFKPAKTGLGDEKLWLCPSLDDSSDDISGNGNHGTYNGGMGTVADTSNGGTRAYSFTSDDFIDVSGLDLGGLNKFTWSAWIYDDYPYWAYNAHNGIFSHRFASNGFTDEIYFFSRTTSDIYFQVNNGADGSEIYGSNYQSWIHACIVYDGTQASSNDRIKYYVNGTLQSYTSTFSVPTSLATTTVTPVTRIGHYASVATTDTAHYFNGKQDDIRVFDRALTTSEITALASKRGYEVPAASSGSSGSIPHPLSAPIFHPLG